MPSVRFPRLPALAATGSALAILALALPAAGVAATGAISTVAGTGAGGIGGDGGPATGAQLAVPAAVKPLPDGGYLVADQTSLVRRVSPGGVISTFAGTKDTVANGGVAGYSGDGGPATSAKLNAPSGIGVAPDGSVYLADINNNAIRKVAPNGTITTAVGDAFAEFDGDGGPAAPPGAPAAANGASVRFPYDVAFYPDGSYLIADQDNGRVRKVSAAGIISTVAGGGAPGPASSALSATLVEVAGLAILPDGGFLVTEYTGNRVRRVFPNGTIATVVGTGAASSTGDGGPATAATINQPVKIALMPDGGYVIAEAGGNRIRRVSPGGTISTVAGTGVRGFGGDGGPATGAKLDQPFGVSVDAEGDLLVADLGNKRIRKVDLGDPPPVATPTPVPAGPTATLTPEPTAAPAPAPVPPTAKLAAIAPTCVGIPVKFDASASTPGTGGPIVEYTFKKVELGARVPAAAEKGPKEAKSARLFAAVGQPFAVGVAGTNRGITVPTGTSPTTETVVAQAQAALAEAPFTWGYATDSTSWEKKGKPSTWARPPAAAEVTVKDALGQTSTARVPVEFAQPTSDAPRSPCPGGEVAKEKSAKELAAEVPTFNEKGLVAEVNAQAAKLKLDLACPAGAGACEGTVLAMLTSIAKEEARLQAQDRLEKRKERNEELRDKKAKIDRANAKLTEQARAASEKAERLMDQSMSAMIAGLLQGTAAAASTVSTQQKVAEGILESVAEVERARNDGKSVSQQRREQRQKELIGKAKRAEVAGSSSFQGQKGEPQSIDVPLSNDLRKLLEKYGEARLAVAVTTVSDTGQPVTKVKDVTVTVPDGAKKPNPKPAATPAPKRGV